MREEATPTLPAKTNPLPFYLRRHLMVLILAAGTCFCGGRGRAAADLDAAIGFNGRYVSGMWTTVRVLASNLPDPKKPNEKLRDIQGRVSVTSFDTEGRPVRFEREIDLPRQARKIVEFTMIPSQRGQLRIELQTEGGRTLASRTVQPGDPGTADLRDDLGYRPIVLLDSDPNDSAAFPAQCASAFEIQRIPLEALPSDYKGYASVRLLVVRRRLGTHLTDEQFTALKTWLETGGRLLVVTPKAQAEIKLDPLHELLPAAIDTAREVRMEELLPGSGGDLTLQTTWAERRPGCRTLWSCAAGDLALVRRIGAGWIAACAIDPGAVTGDALKAPLGLQLQAFLETQLLAPSREDLRVRHIFSTGDVNPEFSGVNLLPNPLIVIVILLSFVILVGPVNFYLLRKRRRLELAWFTIPILSIVFFFAIYGYGVYSKGGSHHYAEAEILHLPEGGGPGLLLWTGSQFSPANRSYEFKPPATGSAMPLLQYFTPAAYGQNQLLQAFNFSTRGVIGSAGRPSVLTGGSTAAFALSRPVDQWTMAFYNGEEMIETEERIEGAMTLRGDNSARVVIHNKTSSPLTESVVFLGDLAYRIGEIVPGATFDEVITQPVPAESYVNTLETRTGDTFASKAAAMIQAGAMTQFPFTKAHHPQRRCRFVAGRMGPLSTARLSPAPDFSKSVSLVEVELPLSLEGEVTLNDGGRGQPSLLRFDVSDFDRDKGRFFDIPDGFGILNEGFAEVVISPPALDAKARCTGGNFTLGCALYDKVLLIEAYNYRKGGWDEAARAEPSRTPQREAPFNGKYELQPDWINPIAPQARIRVSAVEPKEKPSGGIAGFQSNYGAHISQFWASMTFAGQPPAPNETTGTREADKP